MGFASWQRYCTASSSGHQPNFAALNRGRHLCSAGRPSGWALPHILVVNFLSSVFEYFEFDTVVWAKGRVSAQYKHVPDITRVSVMVDMTRAGGTLE